MSVVEPNGRRTIFATHEPFWILETVPVVCADAAEGGNKTNSQFSSRTSGALDIIRWRRRAVAQQDGKEIANVYAKLERRAAHEHFEPSLFEVALALGAFVLIDLRRMLLSEQPPRLFGGIKPLVVCIGVRTDLSQ